MVPLKIVSNVSRFMPALYFNRNLADLSRGSNSLNSASVQINISPSCHTLECIAVLSRVNESIQEFVTCKPNILVLLIDALETLHKIQIFQQDRKDSKMQRWERTIEWEITEIYLPFKSHMKNLQKVFYSSIFCKA